MIKINDWQNVNWIDGESYLANVGYDGELEINASNISIDMGLNVFNGMDLDRAVDILKNINVSLSGGIYKNAGIGVYGSMGGDTGYGKHQGLILNAPIIMECEIGFKHFGSNSKVIAAQISNIETDGVWSKGNNNEFGHCYIDKVDLSANNEGDCIHINESDNPFVHHCMLDHRNSTNKQALIVGQQYDGARIEDNYCIGGKYVMNIKNNNSSIKRNTIIPIQGTERILNYGEADSVLTEDNIIVVRYGLKPYDDWKATNVINRDVIL